jgi:hypothetical protein
LSLDRTHLSALGLVTDSYTAGDMISRLMKVARSSTTAWPISHDEQKPPWNGSLLLVQAVIWPLHTSTLWVWETWESLGDSHKRANHTMDQPAEEAANLDLVDIAYKGWLCAPSTRSAWGGGGTRAWVRQFPRMRLKLLSFKFNRWSSLSLLGKAFRHGGWSSTQIRSVEKAGERQARIVR